MNVKKFAFLATGLVLSTACTFAAEKNGYHSELIAKNTHSTAYTNVYTQATQTIAPNAAFLFEGHTRTKHVNIEKAKKKGIVTILKDGKYAIRYIVRSNNFTGTQTAITLNGKVVPASKISGNTPAGFGFGFSMSNEVILRLEKHDKLQLKNIGTAPIILDGQDDGTVAELTIQKL
jgi:hypothetical protein